MQKYIIESLLISAALSTDAFMSGLAYSADKIRIPLRSVITIAAICTGVFALALFLAVPFGNLMPASITTPVSVVLLSLLGLVKIFDSALKAYIRKQSDLNKKISFGFSGVKFVLNVYADPEKADIDNSRILSAKEAIFLAAALSLDGLAVGFGIGMTAHNSALLIVFTFLLGICAVTLSSFVGKKIADKINFSLSWLSGFMLIAIALTKL